jgi:hypothetical protein
VMLQNNNQTQFENGGPLLDELTLAIGGGGSLSTKAHPTLIRAESSNLNQAAIVTVNVSNKE